MEIINAVIKDIMPGINSYERLHNAGRLDLRLDQVVRLVKTHVTVVIVKKSVSRRRGWVARSSDVACERVLPSVDSLMS
jgi:hypothetical protein